MVLEKKTEYWTCAIIVLLLILSKIIKHPPNFSPFLSILTVSTFLIRNKILLITSILVALIVSDLIIGFYLGISILYLVLIFIAISTPIFFKKIIPSNILLISLYVSLSFFILSSTIHHIVDNQMNFNFEIIQNIYMDGISFFISSLLSTTIFNFFLLVIINKLNLKFKILSK